MSKTPKNPTATTNGGATENETVVGFPMPDDNVVQTFQLDASLVRGRVLRLGSVLDEILDAHNYPAPVDQLVAETVSLALILSSMLKYDGIFTLQIQSEGPIRMIVADIISHGEVRACASFDEELIKSRSDWKFSELMGDGYLAFTVDQGEDTDRYQGIVQLSETSLQDSVAHYFLQSEQIRTMLKLAVAKQANNWRAGALMVQTMPPDAKTIQNEINDAFEEDWSRTSMLLETVKDEELLDQRLHENTLLMRLFHEEGVRVYTPLTVRKGCRCSREKLSSVLSMMSEEDRRDMINDGKVTLTCEFCNTEYVFTEEDLLTPNSDA